jgi:hypothetical protein
LPLNSAFRFYNKDFHQQFEDEKWKNLFYFVYQDLKQEQKQKTHLKTDISSIKIA